MSVALVKVQLIKTPISGRPIGLRLKAALDNDGHPIFGPSFNKPYLIIEGSDHSTLTDAHVNNFMAFLRKKGWNVQRYGELIEIVLAAGSIHYQDSKALRAKDQPPEADDVPVDLTKLTPDERQALLEQLQRQLKGNTSG